MPGQEIVAYVDPRIMVTMERQHIGVVAWRVYRLDHAPLVSYETYPESLPIPNCAKTAIDLWVRNERRADDQAGKGRSNRGT